MKPSKINDVVSALAIYLLTMVAAYYLITVYSLSSYTYMYYITSYGYTYAILRNIYIATLLLYIMYLLMHALLSRTINKLNVLVAISSLSLIISNYSHLIAYITINKLMIIPLPLLILIRSPSHTVISLDWGQIALLTIILAYISARRRRLHSSTPVDGPSPPNLDEGVPTRSPEGGRWLALCSLIAVPRPLVAH